MTTKEFKAAFKKAPESHWLATTLHKNINTNAYNELFQYWSGEKNIDDVNDIKELNRLKGMFLVITMQYQMVIKYIKDLNLYWVGEFEDAVVPLEDIGLKAGDRFECKQDFSPVFCSDIPFCIGTAIEIKEYMNQGADSIISVLLKKLVTDDANKHQEKSLEDIQMLVTVGELQNYFKKL